VEAEEILIVRSREVVSLSLSHKEAEGLLTFSGTGRVRGMLKLGDQEVLSLWAGEVPS
jgi:hypothetical protein